MITNITECSRCGGSHEVEIKTLSEGDGEEPLFRNWAMCPVKQEPIVFAYNLSEYSDPESPPTKADLEGFINKLGVQFLRANAAKIALENPGEQIVIDRVLMLSREHDFTCDVSYHFREPDLAVVND